MGPVLFARRLAAMPTYFYLEECPEKETCSSTAWKRAAVWGWNLEDAKNNLIRHLMVSQLHAMDKDTATLQAECVQWMEAEWEEQPQPKRQRTGHGQQQDKKMATAVAEAIRQMGTGGSNERQHRWTSVHQAMIAIGNSD